MSTGGDEPCSGSMHALTAHALSPALAACTRGRCARIFDGAARMCVACTHACLSLLQPGVVSAGRPVGPMHASYMMYAAGWKTLLSLWARFSTLRLVRRAAASG